MQRLQTADDCLTEHVTYQLEPRCAACTSRAKVPPGFCDSSAGLPCSTSLPSDNTNSISESRMVLIRCAMTSSVRLQDDTQHVSTDVAGHALVQNCILQQHSWLSDASQIQNQHVSASRSILQLLLLKELRKARRGLW